MFATPLGRAVLARFISRVGGEAAFFVGVWGKATFEFRATAAELAVVMRAPGFGVAGGFAVVGLPDRFGPVMRQSLRSHSLGECAGQSNNSARATK